MLPNLFPHRRIPGRCWRHRPCQGNMRSTPTAIHPTNLAPTMNLDPAVHLPGHHRRYTLPFLLESIEGQALLHDLHPYQSPEGRVLCCCTGNGKWPQLVIRLIDERYILARMPNDGASHNPRCRFFSESLTESGRGEYLPSALSIDRNGHIQIRLATMPNDRRLVPTQDQSSSGIDAALLAHVKAFRNRMELPGLLSLLWHESKLNRWEPDYKRNWGLVRSLLQKAAKNIQLNGKPICVQVQPPWAEADTSPWITPSEGDGFALFEVKEAWMNRTTNSVQLISSAGDKFWLSRQLAERSAETYPRIFLSVFSRHQNCRHIALARIQWSMQREVAKLRVVEIALLATNSKLIPIVNQADSALIESLMQQKRSFIKPMRYDADPHIVYPSAILADTSVKTTIPGTSN